MKRTIIIDTDENRVELLKDGYNIIERTIYAEDVVTEAKWVLGTILESEEK